MPVSQGFCRSELAREELTGTALIQEALVIVDVFREQAHSYRIGRGADSMWAGLPAMAAVQSTEMSHVRQVTTMRSEPPLILICS